MTDFLPLFEEEPPSNLTSTDARMTEAQRVGIRQAFARLGVSNAQQQFALIEQLTGRRITDVQEMTSRAAAALLPLLEAQARTPNPSSTGNAWADRTEETWIDKL